MDLELEVVSTSSLESNFHNHVTALTTLVKLSDMDLGVKSLSVFSLGIGPELLVWPSSSRFLKASMKGIRVRIAVSSPNTPSVFRREHAENGLVWNALPGRVTARTANMRRGTLVAIVRLLISCYEGL